MSINCVYEFQYSSILCFNIVTGKYPDEDIYIIILHRRLQSTQRNVGL